MSNIKHEGKLTFLVIVIFFIAVASIAFKVVFLQEENEKIKIELSECEKTRILIKTITKQSLSIKKREKELWKKIINLESELQLISLECSNAYVEKVLEAKDNK